MALFELQVDTATFTTPFPYLRRRSAKNFSMSAQHALTL
jgi:hypothetical protein